MGGEWEVGLGGGGPCYSEWMGEDGVGEEVGMKVVGLEADCPMVKGVTKGGPGRPLVCSQ